MVYFGWRVVVLGAIIYTVVIGATFSAFGLFVLPVSQEFGLSRANMNSALIILNFGNALLAPLVGRALDRVPARSVMILSAGLFALSLIGLGVSRSLMLNAAILAVPLAIAISGAGSITVSVLLARWFTRRRGRAMTLAAIGMSLGSVLAAPAIGWLIQAQGWRSALVVAGLAGGAILLTAAMLMRERPNDAEAMVEAPPATAASGVAAATGPAAKAVPDRVGTLLRMPKFWLISLSVALAMGMAQTLTITMVPLAMQEGVGALQAATLVSVIGISAMTGKLVLSLFADRFDRATLLAGLIALGAILNAGLMTSSGFAPLMLWGLLLGICTGTIAPLFYALLADRFGIASFGTVRGLITPITAISGAIIVRLAGEVFDRTGGYDALFATFIGLSVVSAALMFSLRYTGRATPGGIAPEPAA